MNPGVMANSLILALLATPLAVALAVPVALLGVTLGESGRRWIQALSLLTLALPPFFVSGMWMEWVGFAGAWRVGLAGGLERWLPVVLSAGVLALIYWPLGALLLLGAWDRVDVRSLEMEPRLEGLALVTRVLGPTLAPACAAPALVIAVLVLGNFSVPALFQARVWPAEAWVEYSTRFDAWSAWSRSWPLALGVLALVLALGRVDWHWPSAVKPLGAGILRARLGWGWRAGIGGLALMVLTLALVVPLGTAIGSGRTWSELIPAVQAAGPAVVRTVTYASVSATVVVLLAVGSVGGRWAAGAVIPFAVPGIFTGMLLASIGTWGMVELLWRLGAGVLLGWVLRYFFVGWMVAERAWSMSDARLKDGVASLGGGRWSMWRHAVWPGAKSQIAGAWYAVYLLSLWDVETQILVVPPGGETLALMIFNLLHYGHNAQLTALCVVLGGVAVLPLALAVVGKRLMGGRSGSRGLTLGWVLAAGWAGSGCSPRESAATGPALQSALFERVEVIGGKGTGPGFFSKPRSVAVDQGSNLYVVDMTGRVQRFDRQGRWRMQWQMPETTAGRPKGMDAVPGGGVFLVEPHYHRVNRFGADGGLAGQWGVQGLDPGQLWFPRAIAVGADGTCFVSEYGRRERIQRFRWADGTYLGGFGEEGTAPGQLNRAEGLGLGPRGEVYVADSCNHRIQVFAADGTLLRVHGRPGRGLGEFSYPYDVRVDAEGRQYVCEFGNSRVQILGPDDRPLEILGGPGVGPGELNNPWSLCLDRSGNLYVADALNHRVVKYVRRREAGRSAGGEG